MKDGATVGAAPIVLAGWPEEVALAMEKRYLENNHPKDLTFAHASGVGNWKTGPETMAQITLRTPGW